MTTLTSLVAAVGIRTTQNTDGEDIWAVEKRASQDPDGPINYCEDHFCWAVEKRATQSIDGGDILAVEKRAP